VSGAGIGHQTGFGMKTGTGIPVPVQPMEGTGLTMENGLMKASGITNSLHTMPHCQPIFHCFRMIKTPAHAAKL
jgi:hypothetical protein